MELSSTFALLLVVAALFACLNQRFLRLPTTIGLITLTLLSSLGLVGRGVRAVLPGWSRCAPLIFIPC